MMGLTMNMQRLAGAIAVLAAMLGFGGVRTAWARTEIVAGPMVGDVTYDSARLWMQLSTTETVTVKTLDIRGREVGGAITLDVEGPAPFVLDVPLSGLEPDRTYRVAVYFSGEKVKLPEPEVLIRTAPAPGDAAEWTLAFGSCLDPNVVKPMEVFRGIETVNPLVFLFLGDCGYLPGTLEGFPEKHRDAFRVICDLHKRLRCSPEMQPLLRSTAIYGVWDDHDFGTNEADKTFVFAKESLIAWQRYWANPGYGAPEKDNPGVYCKFSVGDVDVFMLDDRMYRDADKDPQRKTMLGEVQLAWLKKGLLGSNAAFKLIACGSQMLTSDAGPDTWGNFRAERDGFVRWLFDNKVAGVMFISGGGGRCFGDLTVRKPDPKDTKQYPLLELTSSPLAQKVADPAAWKTPNPDRVGGDGAGGGIVDDINFGTVEFGGPAGKRHATLRLRDAKGAVKVEKVIYAWELAGQ